MAKAMRISALALLTCMVMMAADKKDSTPRGADALALVACASRGSIADDLTPLADRDGRYTYSAAFSRLPDGRSVTAVMLFGNSRALLLEGTISRTKVGIVNGADFQRAGSRWGLEESHEGAQVAAHVVAIGSKLAEKKHGVLQMPGSDQRSCVGIGIR
jgi:hypothetical protein